MDPLSSGEVQSEDDQAFEVEPEQDPPHWQTLVSTDILALLPLHEIKRQEVINGEESHEGPQETLDFLFFTNTLSLKNLVIRCFPVQIHIVTFSL